ncbi:MAG TPA: choice-of-anchor D domain-containing protein [Alphaproteobacteria bacterium]|nr:choice-of-anchor D domain-containing protein [Alphaproteobacteria bacterium]
MSKKYSDGVLRLVAALMVLCFGMGQGWSQSSGSAQMPQSGSPVVVGAEKTTLGPVPNRKVSGMRRITQADRKAAAQRAKDRRAAGASAAGKNSFSNALLTPNAAVIVPPSTMPMPDYFGTTPNWANSPFPVIDINTGLPVPGTGIQKFVETLPGLGPANQSNFGRYIPIAQPILNLNGTPRYPGSDYYEIGLVETYTQKLHPDLPLTRLRGYKDLNPAADGSAHYLGPFIIAKKDHPVRILFKNQLSTGTPGNLFIPVDTTVMGAGMGPDGVHPYTQNRATLHLHGGNTPWISDGTPHQWTVPAGENTPYKKGVSTKNVPDMAAAGDGAMTFYYPNQQSGRLLWYHDHSYGLTRLNVYVGEAAGYLLTDSVEDGLIDTGKIPGLGEVEYRYGIPLIIQDKTFVPDSNTLAVQDPTWNTATYGGTGNLWFPHVYMPNQNPMDLSGANAMGRLDYGPWFWPPYTGLTHQPIVGTGTNGCPVGITCPATPNPSLVPEAFMDTPVINGAAYPVLNVARKAYRFRVLNASNDRYWNLQLYYVDPLHPTEVKMVPAVKNIVPNWPATWPSDGRDGGVPDPNTVGPPMIQIGTESGLLPAPVVVPSQPINYNYNRRDIVVLNVSNHALFLGPAERADIIVDFSQVPNGSDLILYNDAPAPVPAFDPRIDYYTGDPDQTDTGGAPTTVEGYGPNTRTVMKIHVSSATAAPAFDLAGLQTAFNSTNTTTGAYAAAQPPPHVPEAEYGPAFNKTYTSKYVRIQDTSFTFTPDGAPAPITVPLEPKAIQELFEVDYGRMNSTLGVELPNTNVTIQTTIPYGFVDPPTETLQDGQTQYWKITHNGVDTHAVHFHLFDVQLINRVGWDGAIRPPEANELGWKDTVRMNPLEDAIVALRPMRQSLPWVIPDSVRLLNPALPEHSTMGFTNIDPNGNPIVVTNEYTNFGWEYVWHCHLLGHEENDMMRPIVFQIPPDAPSNLTGAAAASPLRVQLSWKDNAGTATGFTLQRATNAGFTQGLTPFTVGPSAGTGSTVAYSDTTVTLSPGYFYRVQAFSPNGVSGWSNVVQVPFAPAAAVSPTSLAFGNQILNTTSAASPVTLSNNGSLPLTVLSIVVGGTNSGDFAQTNVCGISVAAAGRCTINVTFRPTVAAARAATLIITTNDLATPVLNVTLTGTGIVPGVPPTAPTNLTATTQGTTTINLSWADKSNNETGFYIERSTNGVSWFRIATVGANVTTYADNGLARRTTYYYRVQAYNANGVSAYTNTANATTR